MRPPSNLYNLCQTSAWFFIFILCTAPYAARAQDNAPAPTKPDQPPPTNPVAMHDRLPLWEVGMGTLLRKGPDYPGSRSQHVRGLVFPVGIYRGSFFRVDDDGLRGRILKGRQFEFNLSASSAFNAARSDERQGMPPLDYTFELGPQWRYRLLRTSNQQLNAHLNARAVISTNGRRFHGRGALLEPQINWQIQPRFDPASQWQLSLQANWADHTLQKYFYQVDSQYATPLRPSYAAKSGFLGASVRLGWMRRLTSTTLLNVSLQVHDHGHGANANSPLFARRTTVGGMFGIVWIPWRSQTMVGSE